MQNMPTSEEEIVGYGGILRQLKHGFSHRAQQVDKLADELAKCPYPVLICGDFNDTPFSYTYTTIMNSTKLKDSFRTAGSSFDGTYAGKLPNFRIDYLLHDKSIEAYNYRVLKAKLSDHYPVVCNFRIKE